MMNPELQSNIAIWRKKATDGTLTVDDMRQAIIAIRGDRKGAAVASEQSRRKKAKGEVKSADELLKELGDI